MCLMLCVSPGEGQNIQYYQIKTTPLKEQPSPASHFFGCECVFVGVWLG